MTSASPSAGRGGSAADEKLLRGSEVGSSTAEPRPLQRAWAFDADAFDATRAARLARSCTSSACRLGLGLALGLGLELGLGLGYLQAGRQPLTVSCTGGLGLRRVRQPRLPTVPSRATPRGGGSYGLQQLR